MGLCYDVVIALHSYSFQMKVQWPTSVVPALEAEASESLQGGAQSGLHREFQAIQGYVQRLCLKSKKTFLWGMFKVTDRRNRIDLRNSVSGTKGL